MTPVQSSLQRLKETAQRLRWKAKNAAGVLGCYLSPSRDPLVRSFTKQLRQEGIIVAQSRELFSRSEPALFEESQAAAHRLLAEHRDGKVAVDAHDSYSTANKDFRASLLPTRLPVSDPFVRLAFDPGVLATVQGYLGMRPLLRDLSLWWDRPIESPAKETQLWHRDGDDLMNVKMFVYFNDVDVEAGPFCFIPETHPYGRLRFVHPQRDTHGRATDEQMACVIPPSSWRFYPGPAGTVILCDTCGEHKGLKATRHDRLMLVVQYTSGTPRYPQRIRVSGASLDGLSPLQRRALRIRG